MSLRVRHTAAGLALAAVGALVCAPLFSLTAPFPVEPAGAESPATAADSVGLERPAQPVAFAANGSLTEARVQSALLISATDTLQFRYSIRTDTILATAKGQIFATHCGSSKIFVRLWNQRGPVWADTISTTVAGCPLAPNVGLTAYHDSLDVATYDPARPLPVDMDTSAVLLTSTLRGDTVIAVYADSLGLPDPATGAFRPDLPSTADMIVVFYNHARPVRRVNWRSDEGKALIAAALARSRTGSLDRQRLARIYRIATADATAFPNARVFR